MGSKRKPDSPECPVTGYAVSTSYIEKKCRCDACREWNNLRVKKDPKTRLATAIYHALYDAKRGQAKRELQLEELYGVRP